MSLPTAPIIYYRPMALSNKVELYWQPPVSDGGNVITSYILECANIPYIEILPDTARRSTVTNLLNGTDYVFTIKATNINGNGDVAIYDPVQPGFKPLFPTKLEFNTQITDYSKLNLSFVNPTDIGNSRLLYNTVTLVPVDVTGNVLTLSSLRYYESTEGSNIIDPIILERTNTNYNFRAEVRSRNAINFSDRYFADFIVNPNLPTNGLKLWLDPNDLSTLTLSNNKVIKWDDKSQNRSNATVNENVAPIYDSANSLVLFFGNQYLNLPPNTFPSGNTAYTIFTYVSTNDITRNNQWFLYSGTTRANSAISGVINGNIISHSWYGSQQFSNVNVSNNVSYLLEMNFTHGRRRTLINGNLVAQDVFGYRNSTSGNNIIGSNSLINGNLYGTIGDLIIYDRLLNDIERASVRNYLEKKKNTASLQNMGNLVVWLDAADNNTLYDANIKEKASFNNHVFSWLDKSNFNNYAFGSNTDVLPIRRGYIQKNLDVIEFNQSYLTIPTAYYPLDAFMVLKLDNLSNTYGILGIGPNTNTFSSLSYNTSGGNLWTLNSTNGNILTSPAETSGNFLLMELSIGNNNNYIRRNGTDISNVTSGIFTLPANSNIIIGNNNNFDYSKKLKGYIGEILMFDRQLNSIDRQQIEGYLSWKWGLQSFLPSNHTYKNSAPYLFLRSSYISTFNPSNVNGLQIWLDASDPYGNGTVPTNNLTINLITDKTFNGFNAVANQGAVIVTNSLNSKPTLFFNGSNSYNVTYPNFTTSYTVFAVFNLTTITSDFQRLICGSTDLKFFIGVTGTSGNLATFAGNSSWNDVNANSPSYSMLNNYVLLSLTNDGTTMTPYANGTAQSTKNGSTSTFSNFNIGYHNSMAQYFNGNMAEIIIYNQYLIDSERQKIEGYLAWKWGLQSNLPSNHTYKIIAP
jgi:hypothetical protein